MEKFCKIYYADTDIFVGNGDLIQNRLGEIDEERRERVMRARFNDVKADVLAGGLIIKAALNDACGITDFQTRKNEFGKLYLSSHPDVFFNISHSGTKIVCAVSDVECGVDIEQVGADHKIMELSARFLSTLESNAVMMSEDPDRAFCRLWTLRESYVKMRGRGFDIGLSTLRCDFHRGKASIYEGGVLQEDAFFKEISGIMGYQASVCLKEERDVSAKKVEI